MDNKSTCVYCQHLSFKRSCCDESSPAENGVTENLFKVFLNGNMVARNEAWVSIDSVAVEYAAMVFEGIRGYWNERECQLYVFRLADHAQRLKESVILIGDGN